MHDERSSSLFTFLLFYFFTFKSLCQCFLCFFPSVGKVLLCSTDMPKTCVRGESLLSQRTHIFGISSPQGFAHGREVFLVFVQAQQHSTLQHSTLQHSTLQQAPDAPKRKRGSSHCCEEPLLKVGATGFEPATTWSQTRSATGLRYTPCLVCECKGTHKYPTVQIFVFFLKPKQAYRQHRACRQYACSALYARTSLSVSPLLCQVP